MRLYRLIRYDIKNGICSRLYLYVPAAILCSVFTIGFYMSLQNRNLENEKLTIINILLYFFEGKEPFSPELGNAFVFPVVWLFIFLYSAFLTLNYPYSNLTGYGVQVITRTKSRKLWWLSKCFWVFLTTFLYFAVWYLVSLVLSLILHIDLSIQYSERICAELLDMKLQSVQAGSVWISLVILPVMTSVAVNLLQLCLGLFFDRIYCFLASAVILFASTYFQTPLLIGNFAMVKRSVMYQENGMDFTQGIIACVALIILSIGAGFWRIRKYDILKKHERGLQQEAEDD